MKKSSSQGHDKLRVALFDVDGTLIKGSSTFAGTWFLFNRGMIGPRYMLLGLWYAMLHGLGLATYERIYKMGLGVFRGMRVDEIVKLSRLCFEKHVLPRFFDGALEEIRANKELGRKIVLVSAGPRYLVQVIGQWIRADAVVTAGPQVEGERVTHILDGPVCAGKGKVWWVRRYLAKLGVSLEDCVCYGDSVNDLPLLELVGEAVVVNPDPRLRRVAVSRRWRILRFRKTTSSVGIHESVT